MRIPNYNVIEIKSFGPDFSFQELLANQFFETPIALEITGLKQFEAEEFITNLEYELKQTKVSPIFPYPIYIISKLKLATLYLQQVSSQKELPKHFKVKSGILKKPEIILINKIQTLRDKIAHSTSIEKTTKLKRVLHASKELKNLSFEANTYINILEKLKTK